MAMARVTRSDHRAVQHIEGGKKASDSVPLVVMRHRPATSFFHRQSRLGPIQGLNLRLLVNAQNHGFIRGIQVEADHVRQLLDEALVLRQFERLDLMRLQSMGLPDSGDGGMADADHFGQGPSTPMGRAGRKRLQGSIDNPLHGLGVRPAETLTMRGVLGDPHRAVLFETVPPEKDGRTGDPKTLGNGVVRSAIGGRQADSRSQDNRLGSGLRVHPGFQGSSLFGRYWQNGGWFPHTWSIPQTSPYCKFITETLH